MLTLAHGLSSGGDSPDNLYLEDKYSHYWKLIFKKDRLPDWDLNLISSLSEILKNENNITWNTGIPVNPEISTGFTYLGQFIAHDISYLREIDQDFVPKLSLSGIYGSGPDINAYLYLRYQNQIEDFKLSKDYFKSWLDKQKIDLKEFDIFAYAKFIYFSKDPGQVDLYRNKYKISQIPDSRNDQNAIISKLHLAFLMFHNAVSELVFAVTGKYGRENYSITKQIVIHHYQWIVVNQYLRKLVYDQGLIDDLIEFNIGQKGDTVEPENQPFKLFNVELVPTLLPEFSLAALRIGHSQVRNQYEINENISLPLYSEVENPEDKHNDLRGFKSLVDINLDWKFFFLMDINQEPEKSNALDHIISDVLYNLIFLPKQGRNLTHLTMRKANLTYSGHEMAVALYSKLKAKMKYDNLSELNLNPITIGDVKKIFDGVQLKIDPNLLEPKKMPLWLYILFESKIKFDGLKLGPLGSHLVAEQILWILKHDKLSYLNQNTGDAILGGVPMSIFSQGKPYFKEFFDIGALGKDEKGNYFGIQQLLQLPSCQESFFLDFVNDLTH